MSFGAVMLVLPILIFGFVFFFNLNRASKVYNISKSTLHNHLKCRRGQKSSSYGRPQDIPSHDENKTSKRPAQHRKMRFWSLPKRSVTNYNRLCQRKPDINAI